MEDADQQIKHKKIYIIPQLVTNLPLYLNSKTDLLENYLFIQMRRFMYIIIIQSILIFANKFRNEITDEQSLP